MSTTTDRAVKKAYFSDLGGEHILEFQFSPHTLDFQEGGRYSNRVSTGNFFTDLVWISGEVNAFDLRMFIDRTQESYTVENADQDPYSSFRRFPNAKNPAPNLDIVNLIRGITNSNTSSGFANSFRKPSTSGANYVEPSKYSASPQFKQTSFNDNVGVIADVEALMYYVRPKGLNLSEITISSDGSASVKDFEQGRFVPPPKCRFYFGNMWREGYIVNVKYNLSVMNKQLVPQRMDAELKMICTKWGYLNDINTPTLDSAVPFDDDITRLDNR